MEPVNGRRRTGGWAWVSIRTAAAFVLATAGVLYGNARVTEAWHWCLSQDHEPDPAAARATYSVWALMVVTLLVLGAVLEPLPRSRWYLLPVMLVTAAVLTRLYVTGMGTPAPSPPGAPEEAVCWTMPTLPFLG